MSQLKTATSNLWTHIKTQHKDVSLPVPVSYIHSSSTASGTQSQLSISESFGKQKEKDTANLFEHNLLQWIVAENIAFDAIESPFFQKMVNDIPGIELPFKSATTIRRRIDAEYNVCRQELKENLAQTCQTIAISLDGWSSKNSVSILAIIGHWLTVNFEYKERVLEFIEIQGPHTGENMAGIVLEVLKELGISTKLITITSDNASNNDTLVDEVLCGLQEIYLSNSGPTELVRFDGRNSQIRCIAHVLNRIVKDILTTLKAGDRESATIACDLLAEKKSIGDDHSSMSRLRILSLWISRTPARKSAWQQVCKNLNLSTAFISYDVDTRWNATYLMLKAGLAARRQINEWVNMYGTVPAFALHDWKYMEAIVLVLSRFYEHTELVSRTLPQISFVIPIFYDLHDLINEASNKIGEFVDLDQDIVYAVSTSLEKYKKYYNFMDGVDAYYIAQLLDPRFKFQLLQQELPDTAKDIVCHIQEVLYQQYPAILEPELASQLGLLPLQRQTLTERLLSKVQHAEQAGKSDIDRYLEEGTVRVSAETTKDPDWLFKWWNKHKEQYPRMAAAARDYLSIPASEVSVERLFSNGRDMIGLRRYSLSPETMRQLVLLRDAILKREALKGRLKA
jgi:hypothetical protein